MTNETTQNNLNEQLFLIVKDFIDQRILHLHITALFYTAIQRK